MGASCGAGYWVLGGGLPTFVTIHPAPFPFPLLPFPPPWPAKGPPRRNPESRLTRDPGKGKTGRFADQCNRVMPPKKCRCPSPGVLLSPALLQRVSCRSCFLTLQKAPHACTPPTLEIYGALGETKPTCAYAHPVIRTYTRIHVSGEVRKRGEECQLDEALIYSSFPSFPFLFLLLCCIYLFPVSGDYSPPSGRVVSTTLSMPTSRFGGLGWRASTPQPVVPTLPGACSVSLDRYRHIDPFIFKPEMES